MAIYHCSIKIIGRSSGRSAVACAAYRSGSKLYDEELQKENDYTKKGGVVYSEIILPENAPAEFSDREKLWNSVHQIEKAENAQLAREVEVALPRELSRSQQITLLQDYIQENFVSRGMAADYSIHDDGKGNPHAHIMLPTRGFKANGQWDAKERKVNALDQDGNRIPVIDPETGLQKVRVRNRNGKKVEEKMWERITVQANDWNDHSNAELWRANWAKACNQYLTPENHIDHRSFARQGKEETPTIHEGYAARELEARGEISERCEYNRQVRESNRLLALLKEKLAEIQRAIASVKERYDQWREEQRQIADRRKHDRQQGKTGYAVIDDLLRKNKERTQAEQLPSAPEVQELTAQLRQLTAAGQAIEKDYKAAVDVLDAEDTGDFVKGLLAKGNRRTLEERYQTEIDDAFLERLTAEFQSIEAQREKVLSRLAELRPGVDFTQEQKQPSKGRTNTDDPFTY